MLELLFLGCLITLVIPLILLLGLIGKLTLLSLRFFGALALGILLFALLPLILPGMLVALIAITLLPIGLLLGAFGAWC